MRLTSEYLAELSSKYSFNFITQEQLSGLPKVVQKYIKGEIDAFEIYIEACECNLEIGNYEDAYHELHEAFDTNTFREGTIPFLRMYLYDYESEEKKNQANVLMGRLDKIFKSFWESNYDLKPFRDKLLTQIRIPLRFNYILGAYPRKEEPTYIVKCKVTTKESIDANVCYQIENLNQHNILEIEDRAKDPNYTICVLGSDQFMHDANLVKACLPLIKYRNVALPLTLLNAIRHDYRCIEYHDYLSAYGQMRTFVDLIKDYETEHPITDLYELDRALNLIGGGWGKRNLFTKHLIDRISDDKTLVRFKDGKFDVVSFCDTVLDDRIMAINAYEAIMHQHAIHKLIYIIKLLMRVKTYTNSDELKNDLIGILRPIQESGDPNHLGSEAPDFIQKTVEYLYIEDNFKLNGNLGDTLDKTIFQDWTRYELPIEDLIKIYNKESQSCFGSEAHLSSWEYYNLSMLGYPFRLINESEITYCNAMDYSSSDWEGVTKELYDWLLVKDIINNSSEYGKCIYTEEICTEMNEELSKVILGEIVDDFVHIGPPFIGDILYFPIYNDNRPIFSENAGELCLFNMDEKKVFLSVMRNKLKK